MIRFFTFSQFHNKILPAGSTHLRVTQLIKYWADAELYKFGENPEALIFQKVYMTQDYQFPAHFPGITILDICDPDWVNGLSGIKETIDAMDAATVPTKALQQFLQQLTDKPVVIIPDRFDISLVPPPKKHDQPAKSVVWYGYRHNAETLRPAMDLINELGLDLVVISDDDPMAWQWLPAQVGEDFRRKRYQFVKYREENIYHDLQRADFAILPFGVRPIDRFKSNNKTVRAILAGLPVAHDSEQLKGFLVAGVRRDYLVEQYSQTIKAYDVKESVKDYQALIEQIKEGRDGKAKAE